MANEQNLIKNSELTPSQRHAKARKAGKASAAKRREKRDMRETFRAMLDMPMRQGGTTTASTLEGMDGKNMTVGQAIALNMLKKAMDGDVRAAEFVRDTSGQKPVSQIEVSAPTREAEKEFAQMLEEVRSESDGKA